MTAVGSRTRHVGGHVVLLGFAGLMLFPVAWAVVTSFKPASATYDIAVHPSEFTTDNYRRALDVFPLVRLVANTAVFAAGSAIGQTLLALLAAYGVARHHFRGRGVLLAVLIGSVVVPQQVLVLPDYLLASHLGILDTYLGLVLPQLGSTAVAVYLLYQQLSAFPIDLVHAAQLDGASERVVLLRVVLPNIRGILAALATVLFIQTWNEYLWPLVVTKGIDRATVQLGLTIFQTEQGSAWGPMMAAACLSAAPVVVVFIAAQRRIVDTFVHVGLS